MKRYLLLIVYLFVCFTGFSQIEVKEGSFRKIDGYVMVDKSEHIDINNRPMALIKISTENISAEERAKFRFKGNLEMDFDVEKEYGELYLYLTAAAATFLEIIHPDYGKTEYWFPEDLCDYCGYEMVIVRKGGFDEVKQQSTYLNIIADQPDAMIYIDGEFVGQKEGFKSLKIGSTHTYKIECELYHEEIGSVTLNSEETVVVEKNLRPAYGYLNITSSPENDAVVFVDNKNVGLAPYKSDRMPSGTYKVRLVKEMYKTTEVEVVVTDGNTTTKEIVMPANFVNVSIKTDSQSDIYLNNEFKAKGSWKGRLVEGSYFVEVRKDYHKTISQNLNVTLGKDLSINIDAPQPIYGFLDVATEPSRANIYIDGKLMGQSPRIINNILIGNHELRIEREGCAPMKKTVEIKENETLSVKETLQTGREITIRTDNNDNIFIDGELAGTSPLTSTVSYGKHEIKAVRDNQSTTEIIDVMIDGGQTDFVLTFGKLITINSPQKGDDIYVDGKIVGQTPMTVDFSLGKHEVMVRRGKLYEQKTLVIDKSLMSNSIHLTPRKESLDKYLERGVTFVTANFAYSIAPQTSFGLTFGQVKQFGWYVSAMSNFDFAALNTIDKEYGTIAVTGETKSTRVSVMGGLIVRLDGPVYARAGAGYGMRVRACETIGGEYVNYPDNTYNGIDLSAGLQLNLRNITISVDAVTTNFEMTEVKLGVGVNFN